MVELETGDILIFASKGSYLSSLIKYFTQSQITHVGMVLKDPTWINPCLKGTFLWESGWEGTPDPQDNKLKLGVQITALEDVRKHFKNSDIFVRKIKTPSPFFWKGAVEKLKKIHEKVYNKPYDLVPNDWIRASLGLEKTKPTTDRFWCSALIAYILKELGILKGNTNWSSVKPCDFSIEKNTLSFFFGYGFENSETMI